MSDRLLAVCCFAVLCACDPMYRYEGTVLASPPPGVPLEGVQVTLVFDLGHGMHRWPMTTDAGGRFATQFFHQGIPDRGGYFELAKAGFRTQRTPLDAVCTSRDRFGCTAVDLRAVLDAESK